MYFQQSVETVTDRADVIGRGLRLEAKEDLLTDEDLRLCNVTDARRWTCCSFEDLLCMQSGGRLFLYLRLNTRASNLCSELLGKPFAGKSWAAVLVQRAAGNGGLRLHNC